MLKAAIGYTIQADPEIRNFFHEKKSDGDIWYVFDKKKLFQIGISAIAYIYIYVGYDGQKFYNENFCSNKKNTSSSSDTSDHYV